MKNRKVNCPCGCGSELIIGIAEEGDYFEDIGKLLISVGKKGQKEHDFACVINKKILKLLNKLEVSTTKKK